MKEYLHPIDGKPVIEFGYEDWEAGKMGGVWMPAISCDYLPHDPQFLRPHSTTSELTYFYLPMTEFVKITQTQREQLEKMIEGVLQGLKLPFLWKYERSTERPQLIAQTLQKTKEHFTEQPETLGRKVHPNAYLITHYPDLYKRYAVYGETWPLHLIENPTSNTSTEVLRFIQFMGRYRFSKWLESLLENPENPARATETPQSNESPEGMKGGKAMSYNELALLLSYERVSVSNKAEAEKQFEKYRTKVKDPLQLIPKARQYFDPSARLCRDDDSLVALLAIENNRKAVIGRLRLLKNIEPFITETGRKAYEADVQQLRNYIEKQRRRTI